MLSIQKCVNAELIKRPFYIGMLQSNLLNTSAFAIQIKPKIEAIMEKKASLGTIIACLARAKKSLDIVKPIQKFHKISINYPLTWISSNGLNEKSKTKILDQLPSLNSYYENKHSIVVTYKESMNQPTIDFGGTDSTLISSVCEVIIEYHDKYHSETGLFYEIAKEFYWHNISLIDQNSNDKFVWLYIESKNIERALEVLRSKFVLVEQV
jgi:hypothetical protein